MYKIKVLLEKHGNIPVASLSKDSQEAIETVKILSDDFTTSDSPEAKELDELFSQLIDAEFQQIIDSAKSQLKIKDNPNIPKSTKKKAKKAVKKVAEENKAGKTIPELVNVGWDKHPNKTIITKTFPVIPLSQLSSAKTDSDKKILSAAKASEKYGLGYVVTQKLQAFPWNKNFLLNEIGGYKYVYCSNGNVYVTDFNIGDVFTPGSKPKPKANNETPKPEKPVDPPAPEPEKPVKLRTPILTKSQSTAIERMVNHYIKDYTHIKIEKLVRQKNNDKNDRSVIAICHDTNALFFPKTYRVIDGSGNIRKRKKPKKGTYNIVLKEDFFKALYNPLYNKTECHAAAMKLRDMGDPQSAIYLMHNCGSKESGKASFLRFTKAHELARKISNKEKITYREAYKKANAQLRECKKSENCKL